MGQVSMIGLDIAKTVFQAHGVDASGAVVFRRKLRRDKVLAFFAKLPPCTVFMEACGGAHHWARSIGALGHTVKQMPASYVKPFVKRQKNDAVDAEASLEAGQRPTMRFVPVKSEAAQAHALVFRARDLLVRQRTQAINALRGHLAEFGVVAAKGPCHVAELIALVEARDERLPVVAHEVLAEFVGVLRDLEQRIGRLDAEIRRRAGADADARRLMAVPGVGPITATAVLALAPPAQNFRKGRDFAAWLGLTPLQHSTGGKDRLGKVSKMGERSLRRLLIIGASAVVRQARLRGAPEGSWLAGMLKRKPPMLVTVALANKTARVIWALLASGKDYVAPSGAAGAACAIRGAAAAPA